MIGRTSLRDLANNKVSVVLSFDIDIINKAIELFDERVRSISLSINRFKAAHKYFGFENDYEDWNDKEIIVAGYPIFKTNGIEYFDNSPQVVHDSIELRGYNDRIASYNWNYLAGLCITKK
jgi:hypothetical protein